MVNLVMSVAANSGDVAALSGRELPGETSVKLRIHDGKSLIFF